MKKELIITGVVTGVITGVVVGTVNDLRRKAMAGLTKSPSYKVSGPAVSVVIPSLEEENYLPKLLTSIQNQTYEPIETIVADSSPPESHREIEEICQQYGARCIYVPELGVARARNKGAKESSGDIIVFSDADNIFEPTCIENLVKTLQEDYVIANPVECIIDDGLVAFGAVLGRNWFKPQNKTTRCVSIWKEAFWEIGGYDESYDPMKGMREDLQLGKDVIRHFGEGSIKLTRNALIGSSTRRENKEGIVMWKSRGVRDGVIKY